MKQRKKRQDGIAFSFSKKQITHTPENHPRLILLTAVQSLAVWFLVLSWWMNLTSVFPIWTNLLPLFGFCLLFAVILTILWNLSLGPVRKICILLLLFWFAGSWILRHLDAAVNVLNLTANAYLTVCRPGVSFYPLSPVPPREMTFMFALFLAPLLFLWSLILHIRKGKFFAYLLLLAPGAFILAVAKVPSEISCWLLLLSGVFYGTVCSCRKGGQALGKGIACTWLLAVLVFLSAFASRPLEAYKEPEAGFYIRTRNSIENNWIKPLRDSYFQARSEGTAEKESSPEHQAAPERTEPETVPPEEEPPREEPEESAADPSPETDPSSDFTVRLPEDAPDLPLFPTENAGADEGTSSPLGSGSGSADSFPDLHALSYFRPDTGIRLSLTLDQKPEDTVYYPSAYGGVYENGRWNKVQSNEELPPEFYLQYPEDLVQLRTFCQQHTSRSFARTSDLIQSEFEEHTVYDFEPGPTPAGKDFAEYFLFENQRGFCVHFATTAVLIYRMYGYPARYVQGYAIPPSAFRPLEDRSFQADVTGEMGHAWCEVYHGGEWIRKEHTLPYHGTRPRSGIPAASSDQRSWVRSAAGWGLLILKWCILFLLCLLAVFLLLFAQAFLRRQHRYRNFLNIRQSTGIQRIYCAIYDTAVFQGMDKKDMLSPQGFQTLQDFYPELSFEAMEWLYQTVMETMFYQKTATREETKRAWKLYQQFSGMVQKKLTPSQKFIYKYIRAM